MNPQNGAGSNGRSDDGDVAAKPAKRTQQQHHEQEQEQEQETAQQQQDEETPSQFQSLIQRDLQTHSLDSYPYAFSPLLLFTSNGYFDKGHSNYNAVAAFFEGALSDLLRGGGLGGEEEGNGDADTRRDVDMLEGVVYDRKNMTWVILFLLLILIYFIFIFYSGQFLWRLCGSFGLNRGFTFESSYHLLVASCVSEFWEWIITICCELNGERGNRES